MKCLVDKETCLGYKDGQCISIENCMHKEEVYNNERKQGHWMLLDECSNAGVYCSICHKKVYRTDYANQKIKSKYCPNCGSIMDEEFEKL